MPSFTSLLIHSCTIQGKTTALEGFEQVATWSNLYTSVPCRHDYERGVAVSGGGVRENRDDDVFFFNPDAVIAEGNRIVHDGKNYDVLKVSKMYDSAALHHIEVTGRLVTTD
jgi:hypothetical protein